MKKILFFSAAAALMLASCSSEETVQAPAGQAISFGNAFVNNSTRADLTKDNITSTNFGVYGYMENTGGILFNNEEVSYTNSAWGYTNTQYWTAGKNYWFAAIAPKDAAEFTAPAATETLPAAGVEWGTLKYDNSKQLDLLYACENAYKGADHNVVAFTFNHLLARTMFTFGNSASNANVKFVVSDVKITDAVKEGTITLGANAAWAATSIENNKMTLNYAIANSQIEKGKTLASNPQYMIPVAGEYTVEFTVNVYVGNVLAAENVKKTVTIKDVTFTRGNSYNFTCALTFDNVVTDAEPIVFDVKTVNKWEDWGATTVIPEPEVQP